MLPRALNSIERCYVRFINTVDTEVEILWIDYSGCYMQYKILKKGDFVDVNTYKTHPWIAKTFNSKDRLHINKAYVYYPKTSKEIIKEKFPDVEVPDNHEVRVRAFITLPVYSLHYACILRIRDCLKSATHVNQLELPHNLKKDLEKAIATQKKDQILM